MRKLGIYIILLLFFPESFCKAQPFTHSGYVYNSKEQGISQIPVKLYGKRTDPYDVTFPAYPSSPNYTTGTVIPSSDDATHGPFNIGFSFSFFGSSYTQFYVGSNGWIGFSPGQTTGYTAAYIPNAGSPRNVILADWEDLLPGSSNIRFITTGASPNRSLTVSFNAVPHYGCRSNFHTFQFILYETSNIIIINYASKPLCPGNSSTAGLVNANNTNVVPVGGKNASQWSVTNYSVMFTPSAVDTAFYLKNVYYTNSSGLYTMNPGLDVQSYQFEVRIDSLVVLPPALSDAREISKSVMIGSSPSSLTYYQMDINDDGRVTVSDVFLAHARISGRFSTWPSSPSHRLFVLSEWNVIKSGSNNLKSTYPGMQEIKVSANNGGTSNFYLIRTGYIN